MVSRHDTGLQSISTRRKMKIRQLLDILRGWWLPTAMTKIAGVAHVIDLVTTILRAVKPARFAGHSAPVLPLLFRPGAVP